MAALTDELDKAGRYARHVEDELRAAKAGISALEDRLARLSDALAELEAWREGIEGRPLVRLSQRLRRTFRSR
jgi:hypothetical protein